MLLVTLWVRYPFNLVLIRRLHFHNFEDTLLLPPPPPPPSHTYPILTPNRLHRPPSNIWIIRNAAPDLVSAIVARICGIDPHHDIGLRGHAGRNGTGTRVSCQFCNVNSVPGLLVDLQSIHAFVPHVLRVAAGYSSSLSCSILGLAGMVPFFVLHHIMGG